jgi:hypothetical protein
LRISERVSISEPAAADRLTLTTFEGQILNLRAADVSGVMALTPIPRSPVWPGGRAALYVDGREFIVRATAESILSTIEAGIGLGPGVGVGVSGGGAAASGSIVIARDLKAANTPGGTFTAGAWQTRDLNTLENPHAVAASLATNQLTLPAGIWRFWATAAAGNGVLRHQLRLRDITAAATAVLGKSAAQGGSTITHSFFTGRYESLVETIYELQHRCSTTVATSGFGLAVNFDEQEQYAVLVAEEET